MIGFGQISVKRRLIKRKTKKSYIKFFVHLGVRNQPVFRVGDVGIAGILRADVQHLLKETRKNGEETLQFAMTFLFYFFIPSFLYCVRKASQNIIKLKDNVKNADHPIFGCCCCCCCCCCFLFFFFFFFFEIDSLDGKLTVSWENKN